MTWSHHYKHTSKANMTTIQENLFILFINKSFLLVQKFINLRFFLLWNLQCYRSSPLKENLVPRFISPPLRGLETRFGSDYLLESGLPWLNGLFQLRWWLALSKMMISFFGEADVAEGSLSRFLFESSEVKRVGSSYLERVVLATGSLKILFVL